MFSLRIDIDTFAGLKKGVPHILDILADFDMKASFYCIMGWEGDLISTLKYKARSKKVVPWLGTAMSKMYGHPLVFWKEGLQSSKMLSFPRRFGSISENLNRISKEGHEIGPHGYIHIRWISITAEEMREEFERMVAEYYRIFQVLPRSWSAPFGVLNDDAIRLTEEFGIYVNSYLGGSKIFHPIVDGRKCDHIMVPVTIEMTKKHFPLLQYFKSIGLSDNSTIKHSTQIIDREIHERGWASTFIHSEFEGLDRPDLLRRLIKHIHDKEYVTKTFLEMADDHTRGKLDFEELGS